MEGLASQKTLDDQFPKTMSKACGGLSNHDYQYKKKFESTCKPKVCNKTKHEDKENTDIQKLSFTQQKKIRC